MRILVLNRGSSSVKCCIYKFPEEKLVWEGKIEWRNVQNESIREKLEGLLRNHSFDRIGHRIVHGGKKYSGCTEIDPEVKEQIRACSDFAPLHNLADLEGIEILEQLYPDKPQYALFDTAFHHTLPMHAKVYPVPYEWYEKGIQRYGFHGINFQYCTKKAASLLGSLPEKMVICHLGSGASLCAVQAGKSIDTTMGMTPLEGLVMDTRSGSIDPGILLYLMKGEKDLTEELYERSGLLGVSGISSDMRDILENTNKKRGKLALEIYVHQLVKQIAAMAGSLGGLDVLVFSGGIGENASLVRKLACDQLSFLGVRSEEEAPPKEDAVLSDGKVKVLLIYANEALEIAKTIYKRET